ncbi:guanylyl cyclase beta [Plasmodium gaboni]|uniref:Guanylyl cyclase beta n=1 Tax=Plasmodium gaboni TaxID=647221 RepID=A0ABY1UTG9_9APIC|nr:guanylyl cyclase beta [Plasmodium gaboni]
MKTQTLSLMNINGKRKFLGTNNKIYRKVIINPTSEDDIQKFCRNYFRIYNFSLYNFIRRLISFDAILVYSLFLTVYIFSEINHGETKKYLFIDTAISLFFNIILLIVIESLFELKKLKDVKNANSQYYLRIVPKMSYFEKVMTKDIKVGNIIRIFQGDEFPADVVILYVKNNANAIVDSFKIDGLFRKSIKYAVDKYKIDKDYLKMLSEINGVIRCELPNKNIFCFQGNFKLDKHPRSLLLNYQNFALQSSVLKGAEYIDAVVVYTGADTKKNLNIPQKIEENKTFCIKMNNIVYYLIFMYFFFVVLSVVIKIVFFHKKSSFQNSRDSFLSMLEDFVGLYILVLPIMMYSEKSSIYIIQSLRIENDLRMRNTESEKPKVFNKNKNDALGNVDLLATSRNGVLVKRKELLVSCVINNVMYGKKDLICSRKNFKLPTLNILDSERKSVSKLLNLDERIFKDPENIFFPTRDFCSFLKLFENKISSIYNPYSSSLSNLLKEKYKNYVNEEILNKNVKLTSFVKSQLTIGYNQICENDQLSYNCREICEDSQKENIQSVKIEEFILGLCGCNRIIIYNEKCLDISLNEYKSDNFMETYSKFETENEEDHENDHDEYNNMEHSDDENINSIEYEDICLYNIIRNTGFSIYCYKNTLFLYNLVKECKVYFLTCYHDFLRSNKFSMCILKCGHSINNEKEGGVLYVRGYDFNILPYISKEKNNIKKIKNAIKIYTLNYLKVIILCKKQISNEDIAKYIILKSASKKLSFKFYDLIKLFFLYDLEVIGIIGLKNELKEGVKQTFNDVINFDIRSWIFANECSKDTYLTALQCNLIESSSNLFLINYYNLKNTHEEGANILFHNFISSLYKLKSNSYALVINDESIKNIMTNVESMKILLCIAMRATVVLFCKLQNETKGKIIRTLYALTRPKLTVLGIGTTLNDAYLLKYSSISVCLSLNEHVNILYNISDYVLQEFKFISELLILGRLNRFSLCKVFLWIIYLKITVVSFYFFHNFDNYFSGSSASSILYTQTTFALLHYFLIIAFSAYEIDLPYKFVRRVPYIYQLSRRKYFLNNNIILLTIIEAILISFTSYYILRLNVFHLITHREFTFHIFILNVFITTEKILLLSKTWHIYFFIMAVLIIGILFIYVNIFTLVDCIKNGKCEFSLFQMENIYFWTSLFPILYMNFIIDKLMKYIRNKIYPDISDYLRKYFLRRMFCHNNDKPLSQRKIKGINKFENFEKFEKFEKNDLLLKHIPTPKIYKIKDDPTYYNKSKRSKFLYDTFRKVIDINVKYRNQQLNLEYKTYEKGNKLKLRIIVILLFVIYIIIFSSQTIIDINIKSNIHYITIFYIIYFVFSCVLLIYIRIRNKATSTFFFFLSRFLLICGFCIELYDNISNDILNVLITYSFTVSYIFFMSFKILEALLVCISILLLTFWVYYEKNKNMIDICTHFCSNPYLSINNLDHMNISCLCKKQIVIFLISLLSFTLICLSMKYYEIFYLKKKFLFRYKQKVNLAKQIEILHTMLPNFLVEYLLISDPKNDGIMVGKNISGEDRGIISVIFCDIDDFQNMVSTLQPHILVETLDNLYLYFDKCIKYFNCIKIETVFESYLAASGLSEKKNNDLDKIMYDTKCAIKLAIAQLSAKYYISYKVLDTREHFSDNSTSYDKYINKNISLKIGIHTGKAISGVIGSVKPQYALFGDTVNTASRMKSTSLPDHIHVSYDTYKYLKEDNTFVWKERKVFIKGKGKMKTYLLVDILDDIKRKGESLNYYSSSNLLLSQLGSETESIYEERENSKGGSSNISKEGIISINKSSNSNISKEHIRSINKSNSSNISKESIISINKSRGNSITDINEVQIKDKKEMVIKHNRKKNKIDSSCSKRIDKKSRDKKSHRMYHPLDEVVKHSDIHLLDYNINKKRYKKMKSDTNNENKLIGDIFNMYDKKIKYFYKKNYESNSMENRSFIKHYKNTKYKKSDYLLLDKKGESEKFKRNTSYILESPLHLIGDIVDNNMKRKKKKKEINTIVSDEMFTSPVNIKEYNYNHQKREKEIVGNLSYDKTKKIFPFIKFTKEGRIKKKIEKNKINNNNNNDNFPYNDYSSSSSLKYCDNENNFVIKYIRERKDFQKKFDHPNFNFSKFLQNYNSLKNKKKNKNKNKNIRSNGYLNYTSSTNDGVSYNFLSDSLYYSDNEYSSDSLKYDNKSLIKNKKIIKFDDLFTKIYIKKKRLLQRNNYDVRRKEKKLKNNNGMSRNKTKNINLNEKKKKFKYFVTNENGDNDNNKEDDSKRMQKCFIHISKHKKEQIEDKNKTHKCFHNNVECVYPYTDNNIHINFSRDEKRKYSINLYEHLDEQEKMKGKKKYVNKDKELLGSINKQAERKPTKKKKKNKNVENKYDKKKNRMITNKTNKKYAKSIISGDEQNSNDNNFLKKKGVNFTGKNEEYLNRTNTNLSIGLKDMEENDYEIHSNNIYYNNHIYSDDINNTIKLNNNGNDMNSISKNKGKNKLGKKISFFSLNNKYHESEIINEEDTKNISNIRESQIINKDKYNYFTHSPSLKKKKSVFTKINNLFKSYFKSIDVHEKFGFSKKFKFQTKDSEDIKGNNNKISKNRHNNNSNYGYNDSSKCSNTDSSKYSNGDSRNHHHSNNSRVTLSKGHGPENNKNVDYAYQFDNYDKKLLKKLTSNLQLNKKNVKNFNMFYYKFNDEELEEEYTRNYYREIINIDLTKKLIIIFIFTEIFLSLCNIIELSFYEKKLKYNDSIVIIWLIRSIYLFIITYIWIILKTKLKEYKNNSSKMMWTIFILNIFLCSWGIILIDLSCIHYSMLLGNKNERALFFMKDASELIICIQLIFIKNMLFKHKFFFFVFFYIFLIYSFSKLFSIHTCQTHICCSIILFISINILYFWYSEYLDRIQFLVKRKRNRMEKISQDFLTKILPRQVLEEYQNDNLQLTYKHEKIAFLFADIVGFTKWSKTVSPKEVLKLLQKLISKIDKDTIKLGLYKLFTIGDAYVATSQPNSSITDETEALEGILNILKLAKLILHNINTIKIQFNKHDFNMRIGLHYGSCVGGIIGSVRIRYDMWGLDVLIANKIESNGIPGEIICSEQFRHFFIQNEPQAKLNFWYYKSIYINDQDIKLYVIEDKNYEEDYDPKVIDYTTLLKLRQEKGLHS